jgi:transcriptional regulator with XRE-family HTH domain
LPLPARSPAYSVPVFSFSLLGTVEGILPVSSMRPRRLPNYLRTHRKQSGLSQEEVAFLLGSEDDSRISQYEKRRRLPPLETALACEAIFGIPVSELFAGVREGIGKNIEKRRAELKNRLRAESPEGSAALMNAHKLRWIESRERPLVANQATSLS